MSNINLLICDVCFHEYCFHCHNIHYCYDCEKNICIMCIDIINCSCCDFSFCTECRNTYQCNICNINICEICISDNIVINKCSGCHLTYCQNCTIMYTCTKSRKLICEKCMIYCNICHYGFNKKHCNFDICDKCKYDYISTTRNNITNTLPPEIMNIIKTFI